MQKPDRLPDGGFPCRYLSRREFIGISHLFVGGILVGAAMPAESAVSDVAACCRSVLKPEYRHRLQSCPSCGFEARSALFSESNHGGSARTFQGKSNATMWDYAQVPFPNFKYLEKSSKPKFSIKEMLFCGRETVKF